MLADDPGIDFAGTVVGSVDAQFKPGDEVVLNGWGSVRPIMAATPAA